MSNTPAVPSASANLSQQFLPEILGRDDVVWLEERSSIVGTCPAPFVRGIKPGDDAIFVEVAVTTAAELHDIGVGGGEGFDADGACCVFKVK